jgi:ankyrin repeat protein
MGLIRRLSVAVVIAAGVSSAAIVMAQQPSAVADAARRADAAAVRTLLTQGADVNAPQGDGMTALHWAAEHGDQAMTDMLLFAGSNVSAVTRLGQYTPLHLAARAGSAPVVASLLKAGASATAVSSTGHVTPLHLASAAGNAEVVTMLLDKGADINAKETEWGQTPLIFAASADRLAVVQTLIKRGADVKIKTTALDMTKFGAESRQGQALQRQVLTNAVARGEEPTPMQMQSAIEVAREFYTTGKIPEAPPAAAAAGGRGGGAPGGGAAPGRGGAPAPGAGGPDAAAQQGAANQETPLPNISAKGGLSALHHAVRQGYVGTTKALLDAGALVNEKTGDGHTPLLVALINGQFDVAMELIRRGADVNTSSDSHGVTPLWATINARWQPRTRFPQPQEMDAQQADYLTVMQALLDKGADVNARIRVHPWYMVYTDCGNANCGLSNSAGATAFWRAAYGTDVEAMRFLVKNGADPNIPTFVARAAGGGRGGGGGGGAAGRGGAGGRGGGPVPDGENPVPAAAPVAAGALDPSGLPVVPSGGPGVFPLHAAAGSEYGEGFAGNAHRHAPDAWLATVKYLVEELGADVNQRDNDGYTPMHHAAARGDNEMILYLVSKGADPKAVSRRGQTTVDMANGPVSRISPFPETIKLLEGMGAKNNHRCQSC